MSKTIEIMHQTMQLCKVSIGMHDDPLDQF